LLLRGMEERVRETIKGADNRRPVRSMKLCILDSSIHQYNKDSFIVPENKKSRFVSIGTDSRDSVGVAVLKLLG